jgi:hypothetical protein
MEYFSKVRCLFFTRGIKALMRNEYFKDGLRCIQKQRNVLSFIKIIDPNGQSNIKCIILGVWGKEGKNVVFKSFQ